MYDPLALPHPPCSAILNVSIFLHQSDSVMRATLNGSNIETLVSEVSGITGITVAGRFVYFVSEVLLS